jgi:hypothetical protein
MRHAPTNPWPSLAAPGEPDLATCDTAHRFDRAELTNDSPSKRLLTALNYRVGRPQRREPWPPIPPPSFATGHGPVHIFCD